MTEKQPTPEQLRDFRDHPRQGPIQMLNLLKFHDRAEYTGADGGDDGADVSGREAYGRYGAAVQLLLAEVGARIVWSGTPETVLIGNDGDHWDEAFIVEYPSRGAMLEMLAKPEYQAAHVHREAGLSHQKLIQFQPG